MIFWNISASIKQNFWFYARNWLKGDDQEFVRDIDQMLDYLNVSEKEDMVSTEKKNEKWIEMYNKIYKNW